MFSLTVLDHVRLDSEHAARNYMVHARAADRLAVFAFASRMIMTSLLAVATASAIAALLLAAQRFYQIATIATTVLAMVGFALYSVFGVEARVSAHRAFAHRLWLVCERYRSLIAEADEGLVDPVTLLQRRDGLIEHVHAIYERGFGVDQRGYESERLPDLPSERAA